MKKTSLFWFLLSLIPIGVSAQKPTGPAFYGDPPDETHPWSIHDRNRPQPKLVTPADEPGLPPSDAVVLFDGTNLAGWERDKKEGGPAKWKVMDGFMECVPGSGQIRSKAKFGDCQLHVEWAAPTKVKGNSQGRGNSGVFLMGMVEVQVLDNYQNPTYADGFAGSVYGINPPMANALRKPGEWQSYDIVFRRPIFRDGKQIDSGYITVFCNGVLLQDHTPLEGPGGHKGRSKPRPFPETGPLKLQDHGNTTRFRNIWYRPLPPRTVDGGTDGGPLAPEAAMAKRKEIAGRIRAHAKTLVDSQNPLPELERLMESLIYEDDQATEKRVEQLAARYASEVGKLGDEGLEKKKGEIIRWKKHFDYMVRHGFFPEDFVPRQALGGIIDTQEWNKKK